ncbi:MAG: GntR family transcriptional regulator [Alcaligenaceae bacterium]|nr:MAG: GntR family transcriptional regulator [Alcaligenaceae bacterium]
MVTEKKILNTGTTQPRKLHKAGAAEGPPRYVWLHQCLLADIGNGRYPVGSLLPTEEKIGKVYGVSRHTVREATRKLVESGLISRQPSIGTVVLAAKPRAPYVAALGSLKELMAYTDTTRLEVLSEGRIKADEELARRLQCEPGSEWMVLSTRRHLAGQDAPISFAFVYLRPEFADIRTHLHGNHPSIYSMLQTLHGECVGSVRQQIEASLMPAEAADLLQLPAGSPALSMLRCYFSATGRLLSASDNHYVADRFKLVTSWSTTSESFG